MFCFLVLANCSHFTDEGMDTQRPPPRALWWHMAPWVWWDPNSDLPDPKVSVSKWFGSSGRHSFLFPRSGIKTWQILRKWEFIWSFKTVSQGYFTLISPSSVLKISVLKVGENNETKLFLVFEWADPLKPHSVLHGWCAEAQPPLIQQSKHWISFLPPPDPEPADCSSWGQMAPPKDGLAFQTNSSGSPCPQDPPARPPSRRLAPPPSLSSLEKKTFGLTFKIPGEEK